LQPRRQLLLAEFAVAVAIKLAKTFEHCPAAGRSATTTSARGARPAGSFGQRSFELIASKLTVAVFIEFFESGSRAFDFPRRDSAITVGIQRTQHRDAGHQGRATPLAGRPTARSTTRARPIIGRPRTRIALGRRSILLVIKAGGKLIACELAILVLVAIVEQTSEQPLPGLGHFLFGENSVAVGIKLAEERRRFAARALAIVLRDSHSR
jgi:hypothetical protein